MKSRYPPRSAAAVSVALVVIGAAVVSSWDSGGDQVALLAAAAAYGLVMVGLVVFTVRSFRAGGRRTRWVMGLALGAFAVAGLVGSLTSEQGQAVVFILQMVIGMVVVGIGVVVARLLRRHSELPRT